MREMEGQDEGRVEDVGWRIDCTTTSDSQYSYFLETAVIPLPVSLQFPAF